MVTRPTKIIDEPCEFGFDELFFSTTDKKGVIQYGNEVFVRVSGFEASELFGSAHSVVRHPDMPSCVFQLFWEMLQNGETIAAYVKNLSTDGRYYWVMAVATPTDKGYLSVRLKPGSELFDKVRDIYKQTLEIEQNVRRTSESKEEAMAAGRQHLLSELQREGFDDYGEFMRHALTTELVHRKSVCAEMEKQRALDEGPEEEIESQGVVEELPILRDMIEINAKSDRLLGQMVDCIGQLQSLLKSFSVVRHELILQADDIGILAINAVLAAGSGSQEVISQMLSQTKSELNDSLRSLESITGKLIESMQLMSFDLALASTQTEINSVFAEELRTSDLSKNPRAYENILLLMEQCEQRLNGLNKHIEASSEWFWEPLALVNQLWRSSRTLDYIRLAGTREACHLSPGHSFRTLFDTLQPYIEKITVDCRDLNKRVSESVRSLGILKRNKVVLNSQDRLRENVKRKINEFVNQ